MMRCAVCCDKLDIAAHTDWEDGVCETCWLRSNRITRGYFALCQQLGDEAGWTDRYVMENNILWDMIVAQIRQSISRRGDARRGGERR